MVSAAVVGVSVPSVSRIVPPDSPAAKVISSAPALALASTIASRSDRPVPPGVATLAPALFSSVSVVTVKVVMEISLITADGTACFKLAAVRRKGL